MPAVLAAITSTLALIELPKTILKISGKIEEDLSLVATSKIGASGRQDRDPRKLLDRLILYQRFFRFNVFSLSDSSSLARISQAIEGIESDVSSGTLRKQPYCLVLFGYPGTGKSSFAIQIAKALMTDRYGRFDSTDMVTLNETDEFQSEMRSYHKVVLFDDIGASDTSRPDTKNPWRKVIDFVNNIKKTALNPNVEMKGKVYIQPDLVIITSNLDFAKSTGQCGRFVQAEEAIYRRFSDIVKVESFDKVRIVTSKTKDVSQIEKQDVMSDRPNWKLADDTVSRETYIRAARRDFARHMSKQQSFIDHMNSHFDDIRESPHIDRKVEAITFEKLETDIEIIHEDSIIPEPVRIYPRNRDFPIYEDDFESQSGVEDVTSTPPDDPVKKCTDLSSWYFQKVDWYWYHYTYDGPIDSGRRLFLKYTGVVTDVDGGDDHWIHKSPFNDAYFKWYDASILPHMELRAESKTEKVETPQSSDSEKEVPLSRSYEEFTLPTLSLWPSEDKQIDFILSCFSDWRNYHKNASFMNAIELDLTLFYESVILVFECKVNEKYRSKSRAQVLRGSRVMTILYPNHRILGISHSPMGFKVECDINSDFDLDRHASVEIFLNRINHLPPIVPPHSGITPVLSE